MASKETIKQVIEKIQETYKVNFRVEKSVNAWAEYLSDIEDEVLIEALDIYIKKSVTSYVPNLPVLIQISKKIQELNILIFDVDSQCMNISILQGLQP